MSGANAVELAGNAPYVVTSFGQQSDASASPGYTQAFGVAPGSLANALAWWGYHGVNSLGAAYDNFAVFINGASITGSLSSANETPDVTRYTLTFTPRSVTSGSLSVVNDSLDVEWYWQSAAANGGAAPHATSVSFSLLGTTAPVPEASPGAMIALGLMGLLFVGSRRRAVQS